MTTVLETKHFVTSSCYLSRPSCPFRSAMRMKVLAFLSPQSTDCNLQSLGLGFMPGPDSKHVVVDRLAPTFLFLLSQTAYIVEADFNKTSSLLKKLLNVCPQIFLLLVVYLKQL